MRCNAVSSSADLSYNFTITYRRPPFYLPRYSQYQYFLYDTIIKHRESGKTFNQIAEWLNEKRHLSVRGKKFGGAHVHSIFKKRLAKEELMKREHPPVWSDFSMEVLDKTILMSDFGF